MKFGSYLRFIPALGIRISPPAAVLALVSISPVHAAMCHVYSVVIQGTTNVGDGTSILASQAFSVNQFAIWRDAGVTSHPVEFVLTPLQDLNASAQPGQIELMTNSAFARNAGIASARFDLASVTITDVITFQLDSGISFQLPSPNVFIAPGIGGAPGGLGGLEFLTGAGGQLGQIIGSASVLSVSYFVPRTGGGNFHTPDGNWATISGQLDLVGTALDNASFQGQYQGTFNGNYAGSTECN